MAHIFISDGRLFWRDEKGDIKEIISQFAQEKRDRAQHHQETQGWKSKSSQDDMFSSSLLWGQQAAVQNTIPFRFSNIVAANDKTIYYTMTNQSVTGLFCYELDDGYETRLFHKNDYPELGFDFDPKSKTFVMAVARQDGGSSLVLLNDKGSFLHNLTEGDSIDTNPSFSLAHDDLILFQSSGIARDEIHGITTGFSPAMIMSLNLKEKKLDTILSNDKFDYMLPRQDAQGNIYCIRKPYTPLGRRHPLAFIPDIILFPFRFAVALVGFLDAFTKLFGHQPLS